MTFRLRASTNWPAPRPTFSAASCVHQPSPVWILSSHFLLNQQRQIYDLAFTAIVKSRYATNSVCTVGHQPLPRGFARPVGMKLALQIGFVVIVEQAPLLLRHQA